MKRNSIALAVILFLAMAVSAQTPAEWAVKLGSRNYAEREKAAFALERLGKAALPALQAAISMSDLETKRRATLLIERIEDRTLLDELMAATPVRLQFKNVPLDEALRSTQKQLNLPIGRIDRKEPISFDGGVLPYWQAWGRFCAAARLDERDFAYQATKLKRVSEEFAHEITALVTSKELEFHPKGAQRSMEFAAPGPLARYSVDDRHSVRVRVKWHALDRSIDAKALHAVFAVEVRCEPRLQVTSQPRAEITKIVDSQGQARGVQSAKMIPAGYTGEAARFLAYYAGEIQQAGLVQLKAIPWQGPGQSLKELHGRVRMDVTLRPPLLALPRVFKAVGNEVRGPQGVTVRILEAELTEEGDIHMRLRLDDLDSLAPRTPEQEIVKIRPGVIAVRGAIDVAMERLELLDANGRKAILVKSRYDKAENGKGYEADLLFAAPSGKVEELTLVLTKAARTVALEAPFLVRDVVWTEKQAGK